MLLDFKKKMGGKKGMGKKKQVKKIREERKETVGGKEWGKRLHHKSSQRHN